MSESKPLVFGCRPSGGIPDFLRLIIAALKQSGVSVPLIFNNITRRSDVEKIRGRVERGASLPLDKLDPNLMADLLKLYLLELPEPLVPYENYDKLLGSRSEETPLAEIKRQVATFPQTNMAVVFAPLLLRAQDESMTGMISDALPTQRVLRSFIDNFETLFKPALVTAGLIAAPPLLTVPAVPQQETGGADPPPVSISLKKPLHALEPPPILPKPVLPKKTISFADDAAKKAEAEKAKATPPTIPAKPDYMRDRDGSNIARPAPKEEPKKDDTPKTEPSKVEPAKLDETKKEDVSRELNAVQKEMTAKAERESHHPRMNLAVNLDQLVNTLIDQQKEDAIPLSSRLSFKPLEKQHKDNNVILSQGWKFEQGNANVTIEQQLPFVIIDQEKNFPHYEAFFYGKDHVNYLAPETDIGPIVISVEKKADDSSSFSTKALLRSIEAYEMLALPQKIKKAGDLNKALKSSYPQLAEVHMKEIRERTGDGDLSKNLLNYERANIFNNCKFGVLYRRAGQVNEDEMFANNSPSAAFEEFMQLIGSRITLHGWPGFRGGLDTQRGTTGTHSYYTKFAGFEIMYHVAPLLPFYPNDKQQLERKRHLGNDIVVIVFQDVDEPFAPAWIKSEFIHIYGVVSPVDDGKRYKFSVAAKEDVPACGPFLPSPAIFEKDDNFKNFLLTKLVNLERVSLYAPVFADKMKRTRKRLLDACNKEFRDKDADKSKGTFRLAPSATKTKLEKIFSTVRLPGKKEEVAISTPSNFSKGPAISAPLNMHPDQPRELSPAHTREAGGDPARAMSPDPTKKRGKLLPEWTLAAERNETAARQRSGSNFTEPPSQAATTAAAGPAEPKKDSTPPARQEQSPAEARHSPTPTRPPREESPNTASNPSTSATGSGSTPSLPKINSGEVEASKDEVEEPPQARLTPKERVLLAQLEADAKAVAGDVRSLLSQVQSAFLTKPTHEEVGPLQSLLKAGQTALETQAPDAAPSMLVKRPPADSLKRLLDGPGVDAIPPKFTALLDALKQQEKEVEIAPTPDEGLRRARPMVAVLKICRAYLDKQVMTLEEEQQKLRELRTSIVTAARDVQYRLVFLQSQLRTGVLSAERALPLLKEISKKLGLESVCGAADAVTRLQRLVKELSAERVALDQRLLLARFVEIGQLVRGARKELMTNYDVQMIPLAQLGQVDPGYALSACTMELENLYTNLAEEVRTLEEAVAYARLVRAIKKFIKGQDLLPAAIVKPTPSEKPLSELERMKLNSLREVSAYGIMEIKSKMQLDSLNSMKDTEDEEPGVRFDLISQCLLLETVKDFIISFRPEAKVPPSITLTGSSSPALTTSAAHVTTAPPTAETQPKGSSGKTLTDILNKPPASPATTHGPQDAQEWAKLAALKKAMMETAEDLIGALIALQKQTVTCTDVGQASAIARLAVGLKAVCNGTVDPTQVEFVRKVEPSPNPATPEELANISNLRSVAEVVLDETRGWIVAQKKALQTAEDLPSAVKIGKGVNLLRKLLEAYLR